MLSPRQPALLLAAALAVGFFAAPAAGEDPLRIGVLAYRPKPMADAQWRPVAAYLQAALGQPVTLTVYDREELDAAAARREVDLVITTAAQSIGLQHTSGLSAPLATVIMREGAHALSRYGGVIFARAERADLASLADLDGRRIAVPSRDAFGALQAQLLELVEAGVPPPPGDRLLVTGWPQDRVVEAVLAGRADAGFVRTGVLEALEKEGALDLRRVKVLHRQDLPGFPYLGSTRLYPEWPVAAMPQVDRHLASRVAAALFVMPRGALGGAAAGINGFEIPASYDGVESLLRRLRLPPFDRPPEITAADLWRRYGAGIAALAVTLLLLAAATGGLVLLYRRSRRALRALERSEARYRGLYQSTPVMLHSIDREGRLVSVSDHWLETLGYAREEVLGRPSTDFLTEASRRRAAELLPEFLRTGHCQDVEYDLVRKDGQVLECRLSATAERGADGQVIRSLAVVTDVTEQRRNAAVNAARLHLVQFAPAHTLEEVLEETLNEVERLVGSSIGFYHFVDDDQQSVWLQTWSRRAKAESAKAEGKGLRNPIAQGGVGADAVGRRPVVHNDHAAAPQWKGLPEGHAEVVRELVVPVTRGEKTVALVGTGNKPTPFDEKDVDAVSLLADLAWEIAERKRSEEALRDRERRYRVVFENSPVSIWEEDFAAVKAILDGLRRDGVSDLGAHLAAHPEILRACAEAARIVDVNRAALELHGATSKEQLFAGLVGTFTPESFDTFQEELVCLWGGGTELARDAVVKRLDGERRHVTVHFSVCAGYEATLSKVIVSLVDVTDRQRAEDEVRRLAQQLEGRVAQRTAQLEEANRELEAFAYSVSHDLRSPLRHVAGFVELLQRKLGAAADPSVRHYMEAISGAAARMGRLIEDLLAFSRMGRKEMARQPVELEVVVEEAIRELAPEARGRVVRWRRGALPVVAGDRAMLRAVLVNLLSNALKFTRPRAEAEIEIGAAGRGGEVVISVRDNGVGFDMRYVDKLFGVFQRLHAATEFEGTGIGLANVRRIVARHGGRTWAEGTVDGGATFYFSLPARGEATEPARAAG